MPIVWGGKTVEEVGFDKIRQQLAMLQELKIVLLDGMCLTDNGGAVESAKIRGTCPKIQELDLSRNLFEQWEGIAAICEQLDNLRSLKVR